MRVRLCIVLVTFGAVVGLIAGASHPERPLMKDFLGVNGHTVLFRPQLYRPVATLVRDYHPVEWDLGNDSDFMPEFPFARNRVDWSQVYGSWRKEGWHIDAALMFETLAREHWKNLAVDSNRYAERFARAFGPSSTNALVSSVEIGNEPGKFSDADYRVVFENMARGLKAGNPAIRVATCALTTSKSHDYAKSVSCIAGLEALYEVLNVHTYAQLEGWPTWRRSFPEDPQLKEFLPDVRKLCAWRDEHAPGKEVWITEFGYDSSSRKPDPNAEFKRWAGVTEEQQAQWLVRSWLLFSAMPIHRAYVFYFNDGDEPRVHGASGLTRNFQPRPAFYAAAQLHRVLGDYRFARVILDRPGEAMVYEYGHATDGGKIVWVTWSPTGTGRSAEIELPAAQARFVRAERMALKANDQTDVKLPKGTHVIPLTESPLYLSFGAK